MAAVRSVATGALVTVGAKRTAEALLGSRAFEGAEVLEPATGLLEPGARIWFRASVCCEPAEALELDVLVCCPG